MDWELTLAVIDESSKHWSQEIAPCQHESIQSHVGSSLMGVIDIGDRDFAERFNWGTNESL